MVTVLVLVLGLVMVLVLVTLLAAHTGIWNLDSGLWTVDTLHGDYDRGRDAHTARAPPCRRGRVVTLVYAHALQRLQLRTLYTNHCRPC